MYDGNSSLKTRLITYLVTSDTDRRLRSEQVSLLNTTPTPHQLTCVYILYFLIKGFHIRRVINYTTIVIIMLLWNIISWTIRLPVTARKRCIRERERESDDDDDGCLDTPTKFQRRHRSFDRLVRRALGPFPSDFVTITCVGYIKRSSSWHGQWNVL